MSSPKRADIVLATSTESELDSLRNLSARVGINPLLTQGSNGNTSIKSGEILWIKASGKWLSNALQENIFVPVDLVEAKNCWQRNKELSSTPDVSRSNLRPSIETAMHIVLEHRVVVHVHSVNTIALAIRSDPRQQLRWRLAGLRWEWVPYVHSGLPLARAVQRVVRDSPCTDVIILGNHGLIICGQDCDSVEALLDEVESRLTVSPRRAPGFDRDFLRSLAKGSKWRVPEHTALHALATDDISRTIFSGGVLYPCQAIFLGKGQPFVIVKNKGILVRDKITSTEMETLFGLAEVIQRVDDPRCIRYLTTAELKRVASLKGYGRNDLSAERAALSA